MDRTERVKRALANPAYFHARYVAPYDPNWTNTPPFAVDMFRFSVAAERGVVMLPPEHLKTTLLSQTLPLWLTMRAGYFGTQLRGLLMSEEEGMAAANLAIVSWHIEHNEILADDFCDDAGRPLIYPSRTESTWREDAIIIQRPHPSRDPTWQAKGLDSKGVHGRRLDWFIGDDLVTPRNAESPTYRATALRMFDRQVRTRLVPGAHALVCGNFNDSEDLVSTLAKRPRWQVFKRPSLHMPGEPSRAPKDSEMGQAVPLWPDAWPKERHMVEYTETPASYRRIHLLDPRAEFGEVLKTSWVTLIDPDDTPINAARYFISVDPAAGGDSDDLDFTVMTVTALWAQHLDVVKQIAVRGSVGGGAQLLGALHDTYQRMGAGVQVISAARVAMDTFWRGAVEIARPDLRHKLVAISSPGNKEVRLTGLGPYAQTGWLRVWRGVWTERTSNPEDQHEELTLHEEWRDFPFARHDDRLDSLDLNIRTVGEFGTVGDVEFALGVAE